MFVLVLLWLFWGSFLFFVLYWCCCCCCFIVKAISLQNETELELMLLRIALGCSCCYKWIFTQVIGCKVCLEALYFATSYRYSHITMTPNGYSHPTCHKVTLTKLQQYNEKHDNFSLVRPGFREELLSIPICYITITVRYQFLFDHTHNYFKNKYYFNFLDFVLISDIQSNFLHYYSVLTLLKLAYSGWEAPEQFRSYGNFAWWTHHGEIAALSLAWFNNKLNLTKFMMLPVVIFLLSQALLRLSHVVIFLLSQALLRLSQFYKLLRLLTRQKSYITIHMTWEVLTFYQLSNSILWGASQERPTSISHRAYCFIFWLFTQLLQKQVLHQLFRFCSNFCHTDKFFTLLQCTCATQVSVFWVTSTRAVPKLRKLRVVDTSRKNCSAFTSLIQQ